VEKNFPKSGSGQVIAEKGYSTNVFQWKMLGIPITAL
jgi:hypothetical protein